MNRPLNIVIVGLSITSSWGNGHATTYRGLVKELSLLGHNIHFLEADAPWYADKRDMTDPPFCRTTIYSDTKDLFARFEREVRQADACIVGSYVRDGIAVGEWATKVCEGVTAFYDIDTPVTLAGLESGKTTYLAPHLIPKFDLYLSFTGGPTLGHLENYYGSPAARPLYCSFDPKIYYPEPKVKRWDIGYMGTYSDDRQPTVDALLIEPARQSPALRAVIAGPQYPNSLDLPSNVERIEHLPPPDHREFYNSQKFTLNVTRRDMITAGYSPSVRLFEAAACGVPIISDYWNGLDTFFEFEKEIFVAEDAEDVLRLLGETTEAERAIVGERARERVMAEHTAAHRARELEGYLREAAQRITRHREERVLALQRSY